jgi:protein phosphatase
MQIRAEGLTDIGQSRQSNEDSFFLDGQQFFYVVADGVGGQPAGEIASQLVAERLPEILGRTATSENSNFSEILVQAIQEVNGHLVEAASGNPAWKGMSTTVVTVWCRPDSVCFANVGDSRAYLIRNQQIAQISEDHTVLAEQQREGLADEDSTSSMAHVLTRCLGLEDEVDVSFKSMPVLEGDRVLLCSDGLTDSLSEEVIRSVILSASKPGEGCRMLVELANRNGGRDNITVVLIFFDQETLKTKITSLFGRRS